MIPAARQLAQDVPLVIACSALDTLHEARFVDRAPAEVYATLLDENRYLCSIRTMYRLLDSHDEVRERRDQLRHPRYQKPELLATAPNQVWSWDITRLLGPAKWNYFYLYVILDVFSRYVVGWLLAHCESADLASRLIRESCEKQRIVPDRLTIHADRGPSMRSQSVAQLLASLGVVKSHSRPHVSNDNPFSESQFKTLKYRPDFPERFVRKPPVPMTPPTAAWINPPQNSNAIPETTPPTLH
jgi:putative transposase